MRVLTMHCGIMMLQASECPADFVAFLADNAPAGCGWWRHERDLASFEFFFSLGRQGMAQSVLGLSGSSLPLLSLTSNFVLWQGGNFKAGPCSHHWQSHYQCVQLTSSQQRKRRRNPPISTLSQPGQKGSSLQIRRAWRSVIFQPMPNGNPSNTMEGRCSLYNNS
jgi:hypothetical protein